MLMHRQAPIAFGVLASCAVIASGSILLREQILSFSSWPESGGGGAAPEIAIPNVHPVALRDAGAVKAGKTTPRVRTDAVRAGLLGLGIGGGTFTIQTPRPVSVGGGGMTGAPGGSQLTTLGRTGSGHPATGSAGDPPLSAYGAGVPITGDAGSAGSGIASSPVGGSVALEPTAAIRVAAPQAADVAPEADPSPVISSADNAPPPADPAGTPVLVPEPAPVPATPDPTPDPVPAPDSTPVPAEPAPPADPAPPVETPAPPPVQDAPAPPVDAPASDPAPEVPPAPADPAPPADPGIARTPAPDPATSVATDPVPSPAPAE